jgi:hypothetical protein
MSTLAIDVSNYTSPLSAAALEAWRSNGVELVIVQAVDPPAGYPPGQTRAQIQQCLDAGLVVDAYVWIWFDLDVEDINRKLALLDGLAVRQVWLDVEDQAAARYDQATSEAKVGAALEACDGYQTSSAERTGVYSGRWFWADSRYMGNTTAFSDRKLWDSDYDGIVDCATSFAPYGGWTSRAIKQYAGTSEFCGVGGVDMNVLSDEEAAALHGGGEEPVPDIDQGWLDKKELVVQTAGELLSVADQLVAEANRPGGPRKAVIRKLADPELRSRAEKILS